MAMRDEDVWQEQMLALRQIQANLSRIVPEHTGEMSQFEQVANQMKHMVITVHRLLEQLKKSLEEK